MSLVVAAALSMDLADLATGVRNVAVNTQDTQLARSGQARRLNLRSAVGTCTAPARRSITPASARLVLCCPL